MSNLVSEFSSTGSKLFWHQEAMQKLRDGRGTPIITHIMPTDVCNFKCAFCSVQHRAGDSLKFSEMTGYLDQLMPFGLKAVILSGGGNPILWRDGKLNFNDLVAHIHALGLEIGVISNGMPLVESNGRMTWKGVNIETLDMLTWLRISLSGWDHEQDRCDTPDLDPSKTTLGGSYVLHDIYSEPLDKKHGRVSTLHDVITPLVEGDGRTILGANRLPKLTEQMREWNDRYHPVYCRLQANCLEPSHIPERSRLLQELANAIDPNVFFVQIKLPRQPRNCYKGYTHPVLNCDGWTYFCDSVVLQRAAGHKFGSDWRVCRWNDVGALFANPIKPQFPNTICPQCVFSDQTDLIASIVEDGAETPLPSGPMPVHVNFV